MGKKAMGVGTAPNCLALPSSFADMPIVFRKDPDDVAVNSSLTVQAASLPPMKMNCAIAVPEKGKAKRSIRKRSRMHLRAFNVSSEDGSDCELADKDQQPSRSSKKAECGSRCSESSQDEKVSVQWIPEEACRPSIDDAPVFRPTVEDFKDTFGYISSIRHVAERYGICRIIPPTSWTPPCPLREERAWKHDEFTTRIQQVDKLQNREPTRKRSRNRYPRKRKRRKRLRFGMTRRCNISNNSEVNDCAANSDTDEKFGFQSGPEYTLESFKKYADEFKEQYFGIKYVKEDSFSRGMWHGENCQLSVDDIEGEYWRIVEKQDEEVEVHYGADLETGVFGSGFPKASSSKENKLDPYLTSGWNLNNFPRLPGSVLAFEESDISGVLVPWLYIGMCFSSFCWHVEDHHLYSLNYMHFGEPKVWYGVPGSDAVKLEEAMRKHLPKLFEEQPGLLHELVTQLSPSLLKSEGVPVYRTIQKCGEFVLTFPRAYHSGFNCGFNCAEAVNVAPMDWLPHGQCAVELYSEQCRKTSVSHDKLLLGAAREAVKAIWELVIEGRNQPAKLIWKNASGKDGVLTKAIKARVEMEQQRRDNFCGHLQSKKMGGDFDLSNERECFSCFYDLHLSAAGCDCSSTKYACLAHIERLCSCDPNKKFLLFRYGMDELNVLVEALEGDVDAIKHWGQKDLGLTLPADASEALAESRIIKESDSKVSSEKSGSLLHRPSIDINTIDATFDEEIHLKLDKGKSPVDFMDAEVISNAGGSSRLNDGHTELSLFKMNASSVSDKAYGHWYLDLNVEGPSICSTSYGREINHDAFRDEYLLPSVDLGLKTNGMSGIKIEVKPVSIDSPLVRPSSECLSSLSQKYRYGLGNLYCLTTTNDGASCSRTPESPVKSGAKFFGFDLPGMLDLQLHSSSSEDQLNYFVKHEYGYEVEPLNFGVVMPGGLWCCSKAIFPKGFRTRVRYLSVVDPSKICSYLSEVLDAGFLGPLFKVTLEERPELNFMHSSATGCWEMVQESLNKVIVERLDLGKLDIPPLHLPGSIDGLKMFGFSSPAIVKVIEDLDPQHMSLEYWRSKSKNRFSNEECDVKTCTLGVGNPIVADGGSCMPSLGNGNKLFGIDLNNSGRDGQAEMEGDIEEVLDGLFKKASPQELRTMRLVLCSGSGSSSWRAALMALRMRDSGD